MRLISCPFSHKERAGLRTRGGQLEAGEMGITSLLRLPMCFELIVLLLTNPSASKAVLDTEIHTDGWTNGFNNQHF